MGSSGSRAASRINFQAVRYAGDRNTKEANFRPSSLQNVRDEFYQSAVEIHTNITPKLDRKLTQVCERLGVDRDTVEAFVHSSSEIQAACYYTDESECLLRFSSSLINLFDEDEFAFVAGHEIGHFLFQHNAVGVNEKSLEYFVFQRAQEISADRIGLLACSDENTAVRALIKTISGLNSEHLQINVGQFLSQLSRIQGNKGARNAASTHPSMLIRTRALMWVSMARIHQETHLRRTAELEKIDRRVSKDLAKHEDAHAIETIKSAKKDIAIWLAASEVASDARFDADEQARFGELFGEELLIKITNFISDTPVGSVQAVIYAKLSESRRRLEELAPVEYSQFYEEIRSKVLTHFDGSYRRES